MSEKNIKKEDGRVRYTKMRIRSAFYELLHEKSYDKITVTAICEKAEINRATFYRILILYASFVKKSTYILRKYILFWKQGYVCILISTKFTYNIIILFTINLNIKEKRRCHSLQYNRVRRRGLSKVSTEMTLELVVSNMRQLFKFYETNTYLKFWTALADLEPQTFKKLSAKRLSKKD